MLVACTPEASSLEGPASRPAATAPGATVLSATPQPTANPPGQGRVRVYLALGDSLAVGVGATRPGRLGYVPRIGDGMDAGSVVNLARSGETSESLLEGGQLDAALALIHSADAGEIGLVTLDIGGNDLLRLLGGEPCAGTPDSVACRTQVAFTLAAFERNYRAALAALREALDAAAPNARLAVMTYFNPFGGTDAIYEAGGRLALLGADAELACDAAETTSANRGMNDIIACVGRDFRAVVADVHGRFVGQGIELTHIGSRDIHANDRGYRAIAEVFVRALASGGQ